MKMPTRVLLGAMALTGVALLTTLTAARADQYEALRADPRVQNGVLIIAIGDIIRDNCSNIADRRGRSIPFLVGLVRHAQSLGYSRSEIEAYVDSEEERDRVEDLARRWIVQQGADFSTPETICAVARDEISAQSAIGRLIRER